MRSSPPASTVPAELVRDARRRAGLSRRALAAAAGLAGPTVSELERGREPRHSTLQALVEALPDLDVRRLLQRPVEGPRPASGRAWSFVASTAGFVVDRLRLQVDVAADRAQRTVLEASGIRSTRGSLLDPTRRTALLRAACVGSTDVLLSLSDWGGDVRSTSLEADEPGVHHLFHVPADPDRDGLRYLREETTPRQPGAAGPAEAPHGAPFVEGCSHWIRLPVRELEISVSFDAAARPVQVLHRAWPATLGVSPDDPLDLWPALYPRAARWSAPDGSGRVVLRAERPTPGLCFGLDWDGTSAADPGGDRACPSLAAVFVRARARHALTLREAARRLEVSPATVAEAERGRDPRFGTLLRYARTFPELSPFELLSPSEGRGCAPERDEVWGLYRELFGVEVEEESRTVTIDARGQMRYVARTAGLLWSPAAARDLRLRLGLDGVSYEAVPHDLQAVSTARGSPGPEPKVRIVQRGPGGLVHDLRFDAESAGRRVTYTRRVRAQRRFTMRADPEGGSLQGESIFFASDVPCRILRVEIRFPRSFWPPSIMSQVIHKAFMPSAALEDLTGRLHPDDLVREDDEAARTIRLTVRKPLVGFKYVIGWIVP